MAASSPSSSRVCRWPLATRLGMVFAAFSMLAVPMIYIGFLIAAASVLGWACHLAVEAWVLEPGWGLVNSLRVGGLVLAFLAWLMFFRPFLVGARRRNAVLEVKEASQGPLFEMVRTASVQARAPMPAEIALDAGGALRLESLGRLGGVVGGRHRLVIGLSWMGVCKEDRFIADMVGCLSHSPSGLAGRCYWLVQGISDWLTRATTPPPSEDGTKLEAVMGEFQMPERPKRGLLNHPLARKVWSAFVWLTQRPLWMIVTFSRIVSTPALRAVIFAGDRAQSELIGSAAFPDRVAARQRIRIAVSKAFEQVEEGIRSERLPDNLPHIVERLFEVPPSEQALKELDRLRPPQVPPDETRLARVARIPAEPKLAKEERSASGLVSGFHELARQLTHMHYQQDRDLALVQFRMVSAGEAKGSDAATEGSSLKIQGYFAGLAHPQRPLCGMAEEDGEAPTLQLLGEQIEAAEAWLDHHGDQIKTVQKEWNMAWQRCRDLEMAHAFALAGVPLDSRDYGLSRHDPEVYRAEIQRQQIVMEHSDESLRSVEVHLEKRFAAALGLVMLTDSARLPESLSESCEQLPLYAEAYEALSARLPVAWGLLNLVHAFDALGVGEGTEENHDGRRAAIQFLVPNIVDMTRDLVRGLDSVANPASDGQMIQASLLSAAEERTAATGEQGLLPQARRAIRVVEGFIHLYESIFAWLCDLASEAEEQLLPLSKLAESPLVDPAEVTLSWAPESPALQMGTAPAEPEPEPGNATLLSGVALGSEANQTSSSSALSSWEQAIASHRSLASSEAGSEQ